jgi:hypothetical protein
LANGSGGSGPCLAAQQPSASSFSNAMASADGALGFDDGMGTIVGATTVDDDEEPSPRACSTTCRKEVGLGIAQRDLLGGTSGGLGAAAGVGGLSPAAKDDMDE